MPKPWIILRSHQFPISLRLDRRVPMVLLVILAITLAAMAVSVAQGEYPLSLEEVLMALVGLETASPESSFVVNILRLPRTLVAFLVGAGLAIAGAIAQGITRNPLAAPSIIGVNAGAALAAVSLLIVFPSAPASALPMAAFGGALAVAVSIYLLAWKGGSSSVRLILVGVGFNFIASALTNLMITLGNLNNVSQALVWLAGSVYGSSWEQVAAFLPWLLVCGVLAMLMAQDLNILSFPDDVAQGLGTPIQRQRGLLLLTSVALAGAAVATAGSIGFVGLMAPHLARRLVGASHQGLLPVAAALGGLLVVLADLLAKVLFSPLELPCGIVTATIGAPFFIYLLARDRLR